MTKKINIYLYVIITISAITVFLILIIPIAVNKEIYENLHKKVFVVKISAETTDYVSECGGVIMENGYILTVAHPFRKIKKFTYDDLIISAYDHKNNCTYYPKILKIDESADLALLSAVDLPTSSVRLSDSASDYKGQYSYIHCLSNSHRIIKRHISNFASDGKRNYIAIDTEIKNGFSGYPVTDKTGLLIGIICSYDSINKTTYALNANSIKKFLEDFNSE